MNQQHIAYLEDSNLTMKKAKLLYAASSRYNQSWHSNPHAHYCAEFFYVTEGQGKIQIENEILPITAHDLVIINPNITHTELSDSEHPLAYMVIGIEDVELSSLKEDEDLKYCILNLKESRETTRFYFSHIIEESQLKTAESEIMCRNLVENLLITLSRQIHFTVSLTPILKKSSLLCINIRQYIDHHFRENLSLDFLADYFHISKFHMVHIFTEEYNISPINYLILKRINEGKKLLKTTDHSLALISRTLGFSSPSYFSQTFRKHLQCSPLEYRKKSRNNNETQPNKSLLKEEFNYDSF